MLNKDTLTQIEDLGFEKERINFSSSYFLMTRVLLPRIFGDIGYNNSYHNLSALLPNIGEFDIDRGYLFKKIE